MSGEYVTGILPKFKCDKHNIIVFYGFYCPTCREESKVIKKYTMDESLSWEERYRQLEKHHVEETTELVRRLKAIKNPPEAEETGGRGESVTSVAF